jgi:hypothetical protein
MSALQAVPKPIRTITIERDMDPLGVLVEFYRAAESDLAEHAATAANLQSEVVGRPDDFVCAIARQPADDIEQIALKAGIIANFIAKEADLPHELCRLLVNGLRDDIIRLVDG